MDKSKFMHVTFCEVDQAAKLVNDPYFHSLDEFEKETFEVCDVTVIIFFKHCHTFINSREIYLLI